MRLFVIVLLLWRLSVPAASASAATGTATTADVYEHDDMHARSGNKANDSTHEKDDEEEHRSSSSSSSSSSSQSFTTTTVSSSNTQRTTTRISSIRTNNRNSSRNEKGEWNHEKAILRKLDREGRRRRLPVEESASLSRVEEINDARQDYEEVAVTVPEWEGSLRLHDHSEEDPYDATSTFDTEEDKARDDPVVVAGKVSDSEQSRDDELLPLLNFRGQCRLFDEPCGLCEGDCEEDSNCAEGLSCFIRDSGTVTESELVPGCSTTFNPRELFAKDFCYNTTLAPCRNLDPFPVFTFLFGFITIRKQCDWVEERLEERCIYFGNFCRESCGYCRPRRSNR